MDEPPSRDAKKDIKALAKIKEAEAQPCVADFLEIIEETPRMLKVCLHKRNYKGKSKFTKEDVGCIGLILSIIPIIAIVATYMGFDNPMLLIILCYVMVIPIIACGVNDTVVKQVIVIDSALDVMTVLRRPFPARKEYALDQVKKIGKIRFKDKFLISATLVDAGMSTGVNSTVIMDMSFEEKLAEAIVARLNYTLNQFRKHEEQVF